MKKTEPEDRKNTVDTYVPPKGASAELELQARARAGALVVMGARARAGARR